MKTNYKKIFEVQIEKIKTLSQKPKLLLHACCAPCSSAVLESIKDFFDITLFFYNPNISPKSEFDFRLCELERFVNEMGLCGVKIVAPEYNESEFDEIASGREAEAEGGARCALCYRLRLEKTAEYANQNGFDFFTTTLSISPYKNAQLLNQIGDEISQKYGVSHLNADFKKAEGYKRSCELSRKFNLYRQNYCGCIYSKQNSK